MRIPWIAMTVLALLVVGCGSGEADEGSSSGEVGTEVSGGETSGEAGNEGGEDFLEVLEAACEERCAEMLAPDCSASSATLSKTQCEYQCLISGEVIGPFCNAEYLAVVNCDVDGGFECVNDYVTAKAACMSEKTVYGDCAEDLTCKLGCQKMEDLGCGSGDIAGCVTNCNEDIASYGECSNQYNNLVHCQQNWADSCTSEGISLHNNCQNQVIKVASCLMDDEGWEICDAWCWLADHMGCGAGCGEACTTHHSDVSCGPLYLEMLDCGLFFDDIMCTDGALIAVDICEGDLSNWQTCADGD